MLQTQILKGSDLSQGDLDIINKYRKIRLQRDTIWDHKTNNYFHNRIFLLVREDGKLVSFGAFRPVNIFIDDAEYHIFGIQSVISIIQGKGYGKALMHQMIKYSKEHNEVIVGFCEHRNAEFYRKSGLKIKEHGNLNFIHKTDDEDYSEEGDVLYFSPKESPVVKAIEEGRRIIHYVPHW